jgi:RNA polymerase sigma-70 factor, ECF subfamily
MWAGYPHPASDVIGCATLSGVRAPRPHLKPKPVFRGCALGGCRGWRGANNRLRGPGLARLFVIPSSMNSAAPEPDDIALLLAVARRDEAAFAALYDRFSRPVFSLVLRVVRSTAEAEEILQEGFWQVWERAPNYQPALGSPFSWIVTIARRKAIDRLRANSRHLQRIADAQAKTNDDDSAPPIGFENISQGEDAAAVHAALAKLAPAERRAITLAFFDGLTHLEIAEALSLPVGTVKARIRRGLIKLQATLGRGRGGNV